MAAMVGGDGARAALQVVVASTLADVGFQAVRVAGFAYEDDDEHAGAPSAAPATTAQPQQPLQVEAAAPASAPTAAATSAAMDTGADTAPPLSAAAAAAAAAIESGAISSDDDDDDNDNSNSNNNNSGSSEGAGGGGAASTAPAVAAGGGGPGPARPLLPASDPVAALRQLAENHLEALVKETKRCSELASRAVVNPVDVRAAMHRLDLPWDEFKRYVLACSQAPDLRLGSVAFVRREKPVMEAADEIPPDVPTLKRAAQARQAKPSYIPEHFSEFPEPHTYMRTPAFEPMREQYHTWRAKRAEERNHMADNLARLAASASNPKPEPLRVFPGVKPPANPVLSRPRPSARFLAPHITPFDPVLKLDFSDVANPFLKMTTTAEEENDEMGAADRALAHQDMVPDVVTGTMVNADSDGAEDASADMMPDM